MREGGVYITPFPPGLSVNDLLCAIPDEKTAPNFLGE